MFVFCWNTVNGRCQNRVDFWPGLEYTVEEGGAVESRLALYLLGPPRIECDGAPIKVNRRKAVALLAYLGVTRERQRRDTLVNLLWPEYDGPRGRAALRRTLYSLRKVLDGGWLEVDREEIGLGPGNSRRKARDRPCKRITRRFGPVSLFR
jgi:hypothetical protein